MTREAVVIIGAGALQVPLIICAKILGFAVLATDGDPVAPGLDIAEEGLVVSTYDAAATAQRLIEAGLDDQYTVKGVCTAGADVAPTVATVAAAFGVPGIPEPVACLTHNKASVRTVLRAGLEGYLPRHVLYEVHEEDEAACAATVGYPLVVKPLTQRASRGVTLVETADGLPAAIDAAAAYGTCMLFEERLYGSEHSAEAILQDGTLLWFNIVDRVFDYTSGVPLELGHINPTTLATQTQQQIQLMLMSCARLLGVSWGPFKVDCLVTADGPKVLEVTARLSGGWDCQRTSPLTGRYPMAQLVQLACGREVGPQPLAKGAAACVALLPTPAMGSHLPAFLPVRADARCEVEWMLSPGAPIPALTHNAARLGFVFAQAHAAQTAWAVASAEAARMQTALELI